MIQAAFTTKQFSTIWTRRRCVTRRETWRSPAGNYARCARPARAGRYHVLACFRQTCCARALNSSWPDGVSTWSRYGCPMRILVIEDDAILADGLAHSLRSLGHAVDCM